MVLNFWRPLVCGRSGSTARGRLFQVPGMQYGKACHRESWVERCKVLSSWNLCLVCCWCSWVEMGCCSWGEYIPQLLRSGVVMEFGFETYYLSPGSLRIMSGAVVSCPMQRLLSWLCLPTRLYSCILCKPANIEKRVLTNLPYSTKFGWFCLIS